MPETTVEHEHHWVILQDSMPDMNSRRETTDESGRSVTYNSFNVVILTCECGEHHAHSGVIRDVQANRGRRWSIDRFISHETVQRVLMRRRHPATANQEGE